jgi:hypothetical protein
MLKTKDWLLSIMKIIPLPEKEEVCFVLKRGWHLRIWKCGVNIN